MYFNTPEAIFIEEQEAQAVADELNAGILARPYHVQEVLPPPEVLAATVRVRRVWRSEDNTSRPVDYMHLDHLTNAAHLCLTWPERFGEPMTEERRAMCQNVRDEIVRRKINEVGK
jgi:hypothetical protein